jgi:hypothetical protein
MAADSRPLLFGTEPLPADFNHYVVWLTSLGMAAQPPWPFTGKFTDEWVEWILVGSLSPTPTAESGDLLPTLVAAPRAPLASDALEVEIDPELVMPVAQCRRLQGFCLAAEAARGSIGDTSTEVSSWLDSSFQVETCVSMADPPHGVPGLAFAILSSKLERFLGDIVSFLHAERDAFPRVSACLSATGIPVPRMLKNLLVHPCLPAVLGSAAVVLLQLLVGPPTLLNLRNLLWHGFVDLKEFPRAYFTGLRVLWAWVGDCWSAFLRGAVAEAVPVPHFYRRPPLSLLRFGSLFSFVCPSEVAVPDSRSAEPPCSPRLSQPTPPDWMLAWLFMDLEHLLRVAWVEYVRFK